jgi:hypothetical protein
MTRKRNRSTQGAKRARPAAAPAYRRPVTALDSEDEAGTYARPSSPDDTGESDDGFLARSPRRAGASRPKKEAAP